MPDGAGHKANHTEIDQLLKRINAVLFDVAILSGQQKVVDKISGKDGLLNVEMPRLRELCQKS